MNKEDLQNLLKEKEKGCNRNYNWNSRKIEYCSEEFLCPICKAEISTLKLAISVIETEKQKMREDFIEWLKDYKNSGVYSAIRVEILEERIQELSNPQTQQTNGDKK